MKLRTRLIISFFIIILVPVLLAGATMWGFGKYQMRAMRQIYDTDGNAYDYFVNSFEALSRFTKSTYENLQKVAKDAPDKLEDREYLNQVNAELEKRYSYLIVRRGEELIYEGNGVDNQELKESLPEYDSDMLQSAGSGFYIEGEEQALIKQIDFSYTDESPGSVFIITSLERLLPDIKGVLVDLIISILLILIFTAGMLTVWIYQGIINPIHKLQVATQNIKAGNLDFTVEVEGKDEIGELCRNFEEMRFRLKESEEEKLVGERENRVLISNISHDLKTPITAIKGYVEGIMDGVADTPEKMDKYIKTIYNKANDMDRLINELTIYSGIDSNRIPYHFHRLNVADYFGDCVEEVGLDLESKNIELNYSNLVAPDTMIIADPEQLKRVINNIIGNSVKYLEREKGVIDIRILDEVDSIRVEIEDNGKGIAARDLPNIFERFYRTDASRNSSKGGSGIGLSIVKKIVEDHGGYIWATSKEGEGTCLHFVFRKYREVME